MNIDHTNLRAVLKKDAHDISDAEKIEAANELHEWLTSDTQSQANKCA